MGFPSFNAYRFIVWNEHSPHRTVSQESKKIKRKPLPRDETIGCYSLSCNDKAQPILKEDVWREEEDGSI